MSCSLKYDEQLNDLLDGELDAAGEAGLRSHLQECAPCCRTLEALEDLARRSAALPTPPAPSADLWPGLRRRIEAGQRFRTRPMPGWGMALAAGLLTGGILIGMQLGRQLPGGGTGTGVPAEPAAITLASADPLAGLRAAEMDFMQATDELLAQLESRRRMLNPEQVAAVEENMDIIREAIAEVWVALKDEPGNVDNAYRLVGLYRTQMHMLKRTVREKSPGLSL